MTEDRHMEYGSYPSLRDRIVVVTGGASGIGEKIVEQFAQQGAKVAFLDIQKEAGTQLVSKIGASGGTEPYFLPCDLTEIEALRECVQKIVTEFKTVDVLVNNAAHDARHTVEAVTPEFWDQTIAVNLKHQFFASQAVIPAMKKARRGGHHQPQLDLLDDPIGWDAGLCHRQGRDRGTYPHAGS
jgi:D-xylose 1-dehydrogenase